MIVKYTYRIYRDRQPTQLLDEWLETLSASYSYALRELTDSIASRKYAIARCSLESESIKSSDYPFPSYH
jgi:putative transposase